jgi:hypothetical protein
MLGCNKNRGKCSLMTCVFSEVRNKDTSLEFRSYRVGAEAPHQIPITGCVS